ncbi:hypothetical protein GF362_06690 [Candidatus Dojkabacteria bacterium]|nr:hypothetical protein [Candidatus Dojkabacteria bacterium]
MKDIRLVDILSEVILFTLFASLAVFVYFYFIDPPTDDLSIVQKNEDIDYDLTDDQTLRNVNTDRIISFKYFWKNLDIDMDKNLDKTRYGNTLVVHPANYEPSDDNTGKEGTFTIKNPQQNTSNFIHYIFSDFKEDDLIIQNELIDTQFCQKVGEIATTAVSKLKTRQQIVNIQSVNNQECLFYILQFSGERIQFYIEQRHRYYVKDNKITRAFTVSATYSEGISEDELMLLRKSLMLTTYES